MNNNINGVEYTIAGRSELITTIEDRQTAFKTIYLFLVVYSSYANSRKNEY